ncbi:quinone oxidoreductase [Mesorhizobium sp. M9A.F.Ca.ET.002.03.1.2]|uniref:quinone oxidoreductase family protein n=1 Tax=Mesorhizobium sp. M9A.F.Ca.ET.002.03.1.2 TaxID=2493668 RepID=UPI000F76544B|nr:quinone oxidoreductase [Mesorhizobium sp. M9A.F.Ca.ET.002.03.1.2]AZN96124.1 quinone oxidoreductase [Mesorhizobium sp. M9A.F.Ca.ET.002.03.1.2]
MTLKIAMTAVGGVEVLKPVRADLPPPSADEVRLHHTAIGVNFVDIYQRMGLYPVPAMPAVLGVEGAGVVEAVGANVKMLRPGDRVAYAGLPLGSYAEARNLPANRLVRIPDGVDDHIAAAAMLRGVTAHMLLYRVYPVRPGMVVLVHAAAGGLGLILTQWAKRLGATVIGTVGSHEKADLAMSHGLDHALLYRETDFVAQVRRLTDGGGVDVAYDGVGGETLTRTLDAVKPFGMIASVGQASGTLPAIALGELGPRRSLSIARPSSFAYANDTVSYALATASLFEELGRGLKINVGLELPLVDAAQAQAQLEIGATVGSILLRP